VSLLQAHEWLTQLIIDAVMGLYRPRKDLARASGWREFFQTLLERHPAGSTRQNVGKKKNKVPEGSHIGWL